MKIKSLELNNFKSFKGKTTIAFESGLTVVTGLNGTGKSNIINGINFVLGKYEAKVEHLIHEEEKEASVKIILTDESTNLSVFRTVDITGSESLKINGKEANNNDIPYGDFNFEVLDSATYNQLNSSELNNFIVKLKEKSNKKQIILVSTGENLFSYANQIITVNQKLKNQSEIKKTQII